MEKIVVFDLDDTLYKEIDYLKSAYNEIAGFIECEFGKNGIYEFMFSCFEAGKNVFAEVITEYKLPISIHLLLVMYRTHVPKIKLDNETLLVLKTLSRQDNIILGLLTDGRMITQCNKITALTIDRYIKKENWIISEDFGFSKPSLEGYLFFQNKYKNAIYYYVGDNLNKDFIAPAQLNWICICLLDDGSNIHKQNLSTIHDYSFLYTMENIKDLLVFL